MKDTTDPHHHYADKMSSWVLKWVDIDKYEKTECPVCKVIFDNIRARIDHKCIVTSTPDAGDE